jgi:hypothetical protein
VLLNAALLLAWQFYGGTFLWANIFFWICRLDSQPACPLPSGSTATGSISFVIGAVIGLVIIIGSILMIFGYGRTAASIIFPMAVFSLIVGGGYMVGFALGIVGTIVGLMEGRGRTRGGVRVTEVSTCSNCGHENPTRNRFCGGCGHPLRDETRTY